MPALMCGQIEKLMAAFVDGELPEEERQEVRNHLTECPACSAQVRAEASVRSLVRARQVCLKETAPPHLRRRVLKAVREEESRRRHPAGHRQTRWVFAAAASLVLAVIGGAVYLSQDEHPNTVVASVVDEHIRCLLRQDGGLDIMGADSDETAAWFRERLPVNVVPPVFEGAEIRLAGGRLSYILDRQGAQLVYRQGSHVICLFILDKSGVTMQKGEGAMVDGHPVRFATYKGYNVAVWESGGLVRALVADLPHQNLRALAASSLRS